METKDIWGEFKDRLNSPFFGSFIISWLLWNWRIPVVLFFYKHEELIKTKTSFIDVINRFTGPWISIGFPLLFAVAYTYGYPYIRRLIKIHIAKVELATTEKIYQQADISLVPVSIFNETKRALKAREKELSEIITEESTTKNENLVLRQQLQDQNDAIYELNNKHLEEIRATTLRSANEVVDVRTTYEQKISAERDEFFGRLREMEEASQKSLESIKAELTNARTSYHSDLVTKEEEIAELRRQLDVETNSVSHQLSTISGLRELLGETRNELMALNHTNVVLDGNLRNVESKITPLTNENLTLKQSLKIAQEELNEANASVKNLQAFIDRATKDPLNPIHFPGA